MLADIKFGLRVLARSPSFTVAGALVLGLGIGVNSMMFTVYNAAFLKSLPFDRPEQVVHIHSRHLAQGWDRRGIRYEDFLEYRAQAKSFTDLAAMMYETHTIEQASGGRSSVLGGLVTANTFRLIGQRPWLGRDFQTGDERPDADPVVILSYALWQTQYGGDTDIVGRTITFSRRPFTVIGVMRAGMEFPVANKWWMPIVDTPQNRESFGFRGSFIFRVIGRLRADVTVEQSQTEMRGIAARLAIANPNMNKGIDAVVLPYLEFAVSPEEKLMTQTLFGAVSLVLLIAISNVANLALSRSVSRWREMSIRMAVGAGRWPLIRQVLIESVLLSLMGGLVGLALALVLVRWLVREIEPMGIPYWFDFSMDRVASAYLLVISVGSGIAFGLAPALQIVKTNLVSGLKEGGQQTTSSAGSSLLSHALVVAEIALTFVLMIGAGLFVRSLIKMQTVDVGFRTDGIITATVPLSETKYPTTVERNAFLDRLSQRLAGAADIESFTAAARQPAGGADQRFLRIADRDLTAPNGATPTVNTVSIAPGYFGALGLQVTRGREFVATDGAAGSESAIVNQRFAAQHWANEDPIGKRIGIGLVPMPWMTVVGVSPTIRQIDLQSKVEPLVYIPFRIYSPFYFKLIVRARTSTDAAASTIRDALLAMDPDFPPFDVATFDEHLDRLTLETRILTMLFSAFASIGVVLAALGVYAVAAYATSRRTREIGIRMALGANRQDIMRLVLGSGLKQIAVAIPIGLAGAIGTSRVLSGVLFEITPFDPSTFVSMSIAMAAIVVIACVIPAWRAARVNPVDALRT